MPCKLTSCTIDLTQVPPEVRMSDHCSLFSLSQHELYMLHNRYISKLCFHPTSLNLLPSATDHLLFVPPPPIQSNRTRKDEVELLMSVFS